MNTSLMPSPVMSLKIALPKTSFLEALFHNKFPVAPLMAMMPLLLNTNPQPSIREATVHHSIDGAFAIRKGDWKLLKNPIDPSQKTPIETTNSFYLVNIKNNPSESENVADKYPEKVEELINEFNSWNKSVKK